MTHCSVNNMGAESMCLNEIPRGEYPRPQFKRKDYLILNGEWEFSFDDDKRSLTEKWYLPTAKLDSHIIVPFAFESKLSGIHDTGIHNAMFYKRKFDIPEEWMKKRIILNFGAVDYRCRVYINGEMAGCHEGGNAGFSIDITDLLTGSKEQDLSVYVEDPWSDQEIPRGKQFWNKNSKDIWYTRTSGIWQTVWIEPVEQSHIKSVRFTPDVDSGSVQIEIIAPSAINKNVDIEIYYENTLVVNGSVALTSPRTHVSYNLLDSDIFRTNTHGDGWLWWPWSPKLFSVRFTLRDKDDILDHVDSYFGMRKISTKDGMVYLNNRPFYMKLVLDQGYWPDGLLTAPQDEDFKRDIEMAKSMGFNGCRKHQKIEDPRFLYWADTLGFLVWSEVAAPCLFSNDTVRRVTNEWIDVVERDYNHPCIVCWVPINESWGASQINSNKYQQHYSMALYHILKSLDQTRLVVNNDGWEMTYTDICAVHNYAHGETDNEKKYLYFRYLMCNRETFLKSMPAGRSLYAEGFSYRGEPILLTECGGIAFQTTDNQGWGYTSVSNEETFIKEYKKVIDAIMESDYLYGFCYTQLTDVEQEINGLLTYDRRYKCNPDAIREINNQWRHNIVFTDK